MVFLSTKNLQLAGTHKLSPRFSGPFIVTAHMDHISYKLDLPAAYSTFLLIFYFLKLHIYQDDGGDVGTELICPVLGDGKEEFKVDHTMGQHGKKTSVQSSLMGYGIANNYWLSGANLINEPNVL